MINKNNCDQIALSSLKGFKVYFKVYLNVKSYIYKVARGLEVTLDKNISYNDHKALQFYPLYKCSIL